METKDYGSVVIIDDRPYFELTSQELIFPIAIQGTKFYAHMRPYKSQEFKDLLKATRPHFSSSKNEQFTVEPGNNERHRPFFDQHFIRASGFFSSKDVPASQEAIKKWFDRRVIAKIETVSRGYAFVIPEEDQGVVTDYETGTSVGIMLDGFDSDEPAEITGQLRVAYMNGSEALPIDIEIPITHRLKAETESQRISYVKATEKHEIHGKRGEWVKPENYDELERLYDELIISVNGTLLRGSVTDESNKRDWISLIPFWHKYRVTTKYFNSLNLKNASSPKN